MSIEQNKSLVLKYNKEVIENCNMEVFKEITTPDFINHSTAPGIAGDREGMIYFFSGILHLAFPGLKVEILDSIAEGDKVTTRKIITGTHQGELFGIPATGKAVRISVIDILTIENEKVKEHWGENNFAAVVQSLRA